MKDLDHCVLSNGQTLRVGDIVTYSTKRVGHDLVWMVHFIRQTEDRWKEPVIALTYCSGYLEPEALAIIQTQHHYLVLSREVENISLTQDMAIAE